MKDGRIIRRDFEKPDPWLLRDTERAGVPLSFLLYLNVVYT